MTEQVDLKNLKPGQRVVKQTITFDVEVNGVAQKFFVEPSGARGYVLKNQTGGSMWTGSLDSCLGFCVAASVASFEQSYSKVAQEIMRRGN